MVSASRFCRLPLWLHCRVRWFHNTGSSLQILQEEVPLQEEEAATMVPLQEPQSCCSPPPASTSPPASPAFSSQILLLHARYIFKHITAHDRSNCQNFKGMASSQILCQLHISTHSMKSCTEMRNLVEKQP